MGDKLDHVRHTRDTRIYRGLDTVALVSATRVGAEFSASLAEIVAAEAPDRVPEDLLGFPFPATRAGFVVVLAPRGEPWSDLRPPASPWSVELHIGARALTPTRVVSIHEPAAFERYFPSSNPWSRAWWVEFSAAPVDLDGAVELWLRAPGEISATLRYP